MTIIYVLSLLDNKYYVGRTDNFTNRMKEHEMGGASAWTTKYPPLEVVEKIDDASPFDEDKYVKQYMSKYGIDNVRGGSYIAITLPPEQYSAIQREIRMATNACLSCGGNGHFAKDCYLKYIRYSHAPLAPPIAPVALPIAPVASPVVRSITLPTALAKHSTNIQCYKCGIYGHKSTNCYTGKQTPVCYKCGKRGHYASVCNNYKTYVDSSDDDSFDEE